MARTRAGIPSRKRRFHNYDSDEDSSYRAERRKQVEKYLEQKEKKRKLVSELIKQALDDQERGRKPDYSNMHKTVQQWIIDDQKRRSENESTSEEVLDNSLLKQLPRDIVFDIIDFIPTFSERTFTHNLTSILNKNSKTSGISVEELLDHVPDSMNPEILREKRKFECAMVYDSGFMTCHKMRLICKEYALRMKKKIFSNENLDLTRFDAENRFFAMKLLSFIKDQQYYHEKNESDNVLMYFHFEQIKNVMIVNVANQDTEWTSKTTDSSDEAETVLVNDTIETSSAANPTPETEAVAAPIPPLTAETAEASETLNLMEGDLEDTINLYSAHLDLIQYSNQSLANHTHLYQRSLPISLASLRLLYTESRSVETFVVDTEKLTPLIGVNTVLKSIKIDGDFYFEIYPILLKACLSLKKVSLHNSVMLLENIDDDSPFVQEGVEIVEFTFPTTDTYELFDSLLASLLKVFPNLSTISIAMEPSGSYLAEDIRQSIDDFSLDDNTKRLIFTIDGTHYKDITPTGRARKWPIVNILITTTNSLSPTFFSTILLNSGSSIQESIISHFTCNDEDIPIERKKEFMDHLFIAGNYPIESCFSGDREDHPLLFQYAVYIANEYQNGRLFSLFSGNSNVENALKYGWQANDWEEVLKSLNPSDFKLVLGHLRKTYGAAKFFKLIRSLALEALTSFHSTNSETTVLTIVEYLRGEQFQFSDIFSPVRCIVDPVYLNKFEIETLHIPFLSYAIFTSALYIPSQILSFANEKDLSFTNENGDSCLMCCTAADYENGLIDIVLKKAPALAKMTNKQDRTPLHVFAWHDNTEIDHLLYFLETYGLETNTRDILGKTAIDYTTIPTQATLNSLR